MPERLLAGLDYYRFVPHNRVKRIIRLQHSPVLAVREAHRLYGAAALVSARRAVEKQSLQRSHEEVLHAFVDGAELKRCSESWESCSYMRSPYGIPGKDFKQYGRLRINALPSRKRVHRSRSGPVSCRACRVPAETLAPIVQRCPRTHGGRILRHDLIVKRIAGGLTDKGYTVVREKLFKLKNGNLKPDLVATVSEARGLRSVILDVQIISANDMEHWHKEKVMKYNERQDLKNEIRP